VIRPADAAELDRLATIWHQGWQDAHAGVLPEELARRRTWERFRERLAAALADTRVVGPPGAPLGLCIVKGDELYQLYVAPEARGAGVAAALIADAEARIAAGGARVAWLTCAIGNQRAARFYEKQGWRNAGVVTSRLETPEGTYALEVWRYEKRVG
jgi:GNAT superfamily N-acetyltransferase